MIVSLLQQTFSNSCLLICRGVWRAWSRLLVSLYSNGRD